MSVQIRPVYDFSNIVEFIENDAEINYFNTNFILKSCDNNNPLPTFQVFNLPFGSSIQVNLIVQNKDDSNQFCFINLKTNERMTGMLFSSYTTTINFENIGIIRSKECSEINEVKISFKLHYQNRIIVLYTSHAIYNSSSQAQVIYCGPTHTFGQKNAIFIIFNKPVDKNDLTIFYELKSTNQTLKYHGMLQSYHKSIFITKLHEKFNYISGNIFLYIQRSDRIIYSKEIYSMNNVVVYTAIDNKNGRNNVRNKKQPVRRVRRVKEKDGALFDDGGDPNAKDDDDDDSDLESHSCKLKFLEMPHRVALGELEGTETIRNWIMKVPESLTSEDEYGDSALNTAILKNNDKAVFFLIQLMISCSACAHFNDANDDGHTPLILLANSDCSQAHIEELVINGSKLDHKDHTGRNVLHYAAINSKVDIVKYIVEEKKKDFLSLIKDEDNFGSTPFCLAVLNENCPEILKTFISQCCDDQHIIKKAWNLAKTKSCQLSLSIISSYVQNEHCQIPTNQLNEPASESS